MSRSLRRVVGLIAGFSLLAQGCSTPGTAVTQSVRVETPGCAQVACELSNDHGSWTLARTPGAVVVTTSHVALKVSCQADDGVQRSAGLASSVAPATGGGAVVGGVVGGAAVGATFGAAALAFIPPLGVIAVLGGVAAGAVAGQTVESQRQSIRYPELISLPMNCAGTAPRTAASAGAGFGLGVRGLSQAEARAQGLGERTAALVTNVTPGGRAAAAGLRAGDVLLAVDDFELADAADLEEHVRSLPAGTSLALRVWRDGQVLPQRLVLPPATP